MDNPKPLNRIKVMLAERMVNRRIVNLLFYAYKQERPVTLSDT